MITSYSPVPLIYGDEFSLLYSVAVPSQFSPSSPKCKRSTTMKFPYVNSVSAHCVTRYEYIYGNVFIHRSISSKRLNKLFITELCLTLRKVSPTPPLHMIYRYLEIDSHLTAHAWITFNIITTISQPCVWVFPSLHLITCYLAYPTHTRSGECVLCVSVFELITLLSGQTDRQTHWPWARTKECAGALSCYQVLPPSLTCNLWTTISSHICCMRSPYDTLIKTWILISLLLTKRPFARAIIMY